MTLATLSLVSGVDAIYLGPPLSAAPTLVWDYLVLWAILLITMTVWVGRALMRVRPPTACINKARPYHNINQVLQHERCEQQLVEAEVEEHNVSNAHPRT